MAFLTQIDTSTLTNQNLSSALLVHTFTNTTRVREIFVRVVVDQVAGNGDYTIYGTIQESGAGSAYQYVPITTVAVASGVTAIAFPTIALILNATDVLKVYVVGLAGDTTTPDITTRVWEEFLVTDASGYPQVDVTLWKTATAPAMTGDAYARLGAPAGASVSADIAALPSASTIASAVWAAGTRTLTSISALASELRAALGLASANLDTQLAGIAGYIDTEVSAIKTVTDKFLFDASNFVKSAAQSLVGYVTPPTVAQIDTQLSNTHGSGAWGPSDAAGANTVVITIQDADTSDTLADVLVTVKDSGDTTLIDQKRTENDGTATFSIDDATYKIHVSALPGYQSLAAQTLVVNGNEAQTYSLTPIAVGAPGAPNLCRVYGYEYQDGIAVENRVVKSRLMQLPQTGTGVIYEGVEQQTETDVNGYWYFDLVIGKTYRLTVTEAGLVLTMTVPNAASVNIQTLL